jgi:hypothetical protein
VIRRGRYVGVALAVALIGGAPSSTPVRADDPPVHVGHVFQPTDAISLPDGRMLVLEKQGVLKLFPDGRDAGRWRSP